MELLADTILPVLQKIKAHSRLDITVTTAARGDSHLEERFWSMIDKTDQGREGSLDQFEIGKYRVDSIFLVHQGAGVIELDGAAFHKDAQADYRRDMEILKYVHSVIRIRYFDLVTFPISTFYAIGQFYPRFHIPGIMYDIHDDPRTANLPGISWRQSCNKNQQIINRIQKGQRNG